MTKLKQHTEAMHSRLGKIANREQLLIDALGTALSRADQKLLDDVRSLTIEHETRRALILEELQTLAARIGAFPNSEEHIELFEEEALDLPYYAPGEEPKQVQEERQGADWREAAKNIHEGIVQRVNGNGPAS